VLNDHERKTLREVERQFQVEDPEFTRSFDTRAQRLRPRPAESGRAALITPIADRLRKVDMQIITQPVPAQDGITRDNVTVRVDAVLYYRVVDPVRVAVDVQDYRAAILQVADWGVHIDRVEIKDVALPESMNRSMSRQAEANANGAPG
jgi:regulator of protease activity HflC (stomatin/prohibitin superfamily)